MTLLMLDGNSLLNRAFYGIKLLSTKDGQFTNGIYGFLTILDKLRAGVHPDGVVAAFDLPVPTFRHKLFEGYKAGRKHMPDELAGQLPILKDLLHTMGCHVVEREGYEADDILGTLARHAPCCVLATGDRDALQLITGEVTVLLASPKETVRYDEAAIREHYGLEPAQLIDLKALMGDASDRIPGVPGIGEKTALELLHQFGTLDALYEQFETSDLREAVKGKLRAGRDSAFVSRTLGTICTDVPIETDCAAYAQRPVDEAALAAALARLEFFKLIEKWGLSGAGVAAAKATPASAAHADADKSIPSSAPSDADLADVDATRVTVPSSSEDAASPPPVASSVPSPAPRHRDTIDIVPVYEDGVLTALEIDGETIPFDDAWRAILCDENKPKRVHDSKTLARALTRLPAQAADSLYGVAMDTMLAAYLCNPLASGYDVPRLLQEYGAADYSALADTLEASLKTTGEWTLL
ncbi:MAG: DNA polymerase I, partial [Oscillospiraceae bacterium]|nr:DNA polymerase I [Oscillospiraceae bacterium]